MSIITKPNSIQKNEQAQISLSKSNLQAIASVEADSYFSDTNNWKEVILYYKSSEGNQKQILKFDASLQSPTATFFISNKARNEFQIQKIVIVDFDNDSFQIDRSELNTESFDISIGNSNSLLSWVSLSPSNDYITTQTSVKKLSTSGWNINIITDQSLTFSENSTIEASASFENSNVSTDLMFGLQENVSTGYGSLKYGFYYDSAQIVYCVKNGYPFISGTQRSIGDIFKIVVSHTHVRWYKNNTIIHEISNTGPSFLKYCVIIYNSNAMLENIVFKNN